MYDYLYNAVMVTDIEEHNSAVVTDIFYPACDPYAFSYVIFSDLTAVMCAVLVFSKHCVLSFRERMYFRPDKF